MVLSRMNCFPERIDCKFFWANTVERLSHQLHWLLGNTRCALPRPVWSFAMMAQSLSAQAIACRARRALTWCKPELFCIQPTPDKIGLKIPRTCDGLLHLNSPYAQSMDVWKFHCRMSHSIETRPPLYSIPLEVHLTGFLYCTES